MLDQAMHQYSTIKVCIGSYLENIAEETNPRPFFTVQSKGGHLATFLGVVFLKSKFQNKFINGLLM